MKYECEICGSIYNEELGDPRQGIHAGTGFAQLPEEYTCRCGAGKEAFTKTAVKHTIVPANDQAFWNAVKYSDHHESDK